MKKKLLSLILGTLLLANGCSLYPDGTKYSWEEKEAEDVVIDGNHITGILGDGIKIDADLVYDENYEWKEFKTQLHIFSEEDADNIAKFFINTETTKKTYESVGNIGDVYRYDRNDGNDGISIFNGRVYYNNKDYNEREYDGYLFPDGNYNYDKEYIKEQFPNENLNGVDRDIALKQFKDACEYVGITISENIDIYALDMNNANRMLGDERNFLKYNKYGDEVRDWIEDDEVYFIVAAITLDGIELPIHNNLSTGVEQTSIAYSAIGKDGIRKMIVSGIYDISEESKVGELCSLEEVLNILATNYTYSDGLGLDITYTEIKLQYVARFLNVDKVYKISPVWVCTNKIITKGEKDGEEYENIRIAHMNINATDRMTYSN